MSSYNNLSSVSRTLASLVWSGIEYDKQLRAIIKSPEHITYLSPRDAQPKPAQISLYLYNITEIASMRNQPQDPQKPPTLLYLNLHYLITPITQSPEDDQVVLGKIMQLLAQTPVLRGTDLQGSLKENSQDLRITLNPLTTDELNKLWTMLATPHRLAANYTVHPIQIEAPTKPAEPEPPTKPKHTPDSTKKDKIKPTKKVNPP